MNNIILIGMPGVGKTTIGTELAKQLNFSFIDTDDLIKQSYKCSLKDIIDKLGLQQFKKIENDICAKVNLTNHIIATGGSVVFGSDAMANFKNIGTIVYLHQPYDVICSRLGDLKSRGVVFENNQTLLDIYNLRTPLYEKFADVKVCLVGSDATESASKIIEKLNKNF